MYSHGILRIEQVAFAHMQCLTVDSHHTYIHKVITSYYQLHVYVRIYVYMYDTNIYTYTLNHTRKFMMCRLAESNTACGQI